MKYLIASDIHGSSYYTKELFKKVDELKIDKVFLLGDILYHGPRNPLPKEYNPEEVFTLINKYTKKVVLIKGNCDSEVDQMVLENNFVEVGLIEENNKNIFLHHGHKELKSLNENDFVIQGHTHINKLEIIDNITYLNPGSIALPKGGCANSFIIIENNKITCYDFSMNIIFETDL